MSSLFKRKQLSRQIVSAVAMAGVIATASFYSLATKY